MRYFKMVILFGILFSLNVKAAADGNVILITFDGVRWREVFYGIDTKINNGAGGTIFSNLWKDLDSKGVTMGDRLRGEDLVVPGSTAWSLPSYQSIMAGSVQFNCLSNECGRIKTETLPDRMIRELKLKREEVATIASWDSIPLAVEQVEGTHFVNAGIKPLIDGISDPELDRLNEAQAKDAPTAWKWARLDKYTMAQGLRYLKVHKPRFLFISLNDTDEWGHLGEYGNYVAALKSYDLWLKEISDTLEGLGDYGKKTTLLVSTDHGRGDGDNWKHHAASIKESMYIWIHAQSPYTRVHHGEILKPSFVDPYSHIDIRPTLETAMGLKPIDCEKCGRVIREIVGPGGDGDTLATRTH